MRFQFLLAAVCALAGGISATSQDRRNNGGYDEKLPFTSKDLIGEWRTDCAPYSAAGFPGNGSFTRYYVSDRAGGHARYSLFVDGECQQPAFSLFIPYHIELGKPSSTQPNTREAFATIDRLLVNPSSEAGLQVLSSCGAEVVGRNHDISQTGCAAIGLQSTTECPGEYELFRIIPGKSFAPGVRTPNICEPEGRPTRTQDDAAATLVAGA